MRGRPAQSRRRRGRHRPGWSTTRTATVALDEVAENAGRMIAAFAAEISARPEVVWLDRPVGEESSRPDTLRVAPLQVGGAARGAAVQAPHGRTDVRHADARRIVRAARAAVGAAADWRVRPGSGACRAACGAAGLAAWRAAWGAASRAAWRAVGRRAGGWRPRLDRARRRLAVRSSPQRHPLRRPPPAAAWP